jgi:polyisoprenoid-binding protein YceI
MRRLPMLLMLALVALPAAAHAATFTVRPGADTKVVFVSKAPTETFEGKTNRMEGTLSLDPSAVGDSITVHLEVDMASLDTGSKLRNQHMRERHLETAKYPKLEAGTLTAFQIEGTFTCHGVSRRLRCDAQAALVANGVSFSATFPVTLGDYNITRPEMLFLKLAETQQVRVSATASSQTP